MGFEKKVSKIKKKELSSETTEIVVVTQEDKGAYRHTLRQNLG